MITIDCRVGGDDDDSAGDDDDSVGDDDSAGDDDDDSTDGDDDDARPDVVGCSGCGATVAGGGDSALFLPLAVLAVVFRRRRMGLG